MKKIIGDKEYFVTEGQVLFERPLVPIRRQHGSLPLVVRNFADVRNAGLRVEIQLRFDFTGAATLDYDTLPKSLP